MHDELSGLDAPAGSVEAHFGDFTRVSIIEASHVDAGTAYVAANRYQMQDNAPYLYKTTDYWYPEFERTLLWNDPALGIDWPLTGAPPLAAKDSAGAALALAHAGQ